MVRPTNTTLTNIKPGDSRELSRVVSGANVPFSVEIRGARPNGVKLHYSIDGGKYYAIADFAPGANYYDPWQTELRDVRQSLDYYLTGGDAESLKYHLEVVPAPMVTSVVLDYEFPSYTKVPPRKNVEGGHIEALEGTTVTVRARTNEPAASAYFDFSQRDKNAKNGNSGRLEVDSTDAHLLTGTIRVQESGSYTIKFKTTGGQLNPDPVVYDIKALPDLPPTEVAFLKPDKPEVTVPSNVNVPILATAADDFGVRDALLYVRIGHEPQTSINLLDKQPPTRRFKGLSTIELASKKLKPGTQIEYWLQVHDTKEPSANKVETAHQIIKITEPVREEDKKAIEQRAEQERADAEKQIPAPPVEPEPEPAANENQPTDQTTNDNPAAQGGAQANEGKTPPEPQNVQPTAVDNGPDAPDQASPPPLSPADQAKLDRISQALAKANRENAAKNGSNPPPNGNAANAAQPTPPNGDTSLQNAANAAASANNSAASATSNGASPSTQPSAPMPAGNAAPSAPNPAEQISRAPSATPNGAAPSPANPNPATAGTQPRGTSPPAAASAPSNPRGANPTGTNPSSTTPAATNPMGNRGQNPPSQPGSSAPSQPAQPNLNPQTTPPGSPNSTPPAQPSATDPNTPKTNPDGSPIKGDANAAAKPNEPNAKPGDANPAAKPGESQDDPNAKTRRRQRRDEAKRTQRQTRRRQRRDEAKRTQRQAGRCQRRDEAKRTQRQTGRRQRRDEAKRTQRQTRRRQRRRQAKRTQRQTGRRQRQRQAKRTQRQTRRRQRRDEAKRTQRQTGRCQRQRQAKRTQRQTRRRQRHRQAKRTQRQTRRRQRRSRQARERTQRQTGRRQRRSRQARHERTQRFRKPTPTVRP